MKLFRLLLPVLALVASPLFAQSQVNLATQVKGVLPVANGGTSGTTGATARSGIGAAASGSNTDITTLNPSGGIQVGSPTGGAKGTGTLNAGGLYVNGSTVGTVTSIATSGLVSGGTITGTGTISLSNIGSGDVVGNSTASSAAPADTTLTAIIDRAIGSTQGQILYRGASSWSALSPGTSGQVLQSGGASANPSWATVSGGGTVTVSGTPTTGNCAKFSGATQITDAGAACGSGGGGSTYERARAVPLVTNFTLQNANSGTIADGASSTGIYLDSVNSTFGIRMIRLNGSPPATPYSIITRSQTLWSAAAGYPVGIVLRNSSSGKIIYFGAYNNTQELVQQWANYTTFNANVMGATTMWYVGASTWRKVKNDGTTLTFSVSVDGTNWYDMATTALSTYITSIDEIGMGTFVSGSTVRSVFQSWEAF